MTVIWTVVIGFGCAGLGYVIRMIEDGWKAAGELAGRIEISRCDWCDGFTTDRGKCNCDEPCTFVPQCGWEANRG